MMETEFVDNVLSRLIELPDYVQIESLRNAKILMDNWVEISVLLSTSEAYIRTLNPGAPDTP